MIGDAWIWITLLIFVSAAVLRQPVLLLIGSLFFLSSGAARLWARYSLRNVQYQRGFSARKAFFGDSITLETVITNSKILPLPFVRIEDEVPAELTFLKGAAAPTHLPTRNVLLRTVSLGWYHRLRHRYQMRCPRRGVFVFGPAKVRSGDLFGLFQKEMEFAGTDRLVVYPRVVPLEKLGIPSREPFGDLRVRRHLFCDPVQTVSTRDYACGDPLRHIHWKSTARLQRLQSRLFEKTTTMDLALFLDTQTLPPPLFGISEQSLETAIIVAASIASYGLSQGYSTGLYVNELYRESNREMSLAPSDHPQQLPRILEALAHVRGFPSRRAHDMVAGKAKSLPWGATIAFVTASPTKPLLATLDQLRRAGRRVVLIAVGQESATIGPTGMTVYHVSEKVYEREVAALRIERPSGAQA